ncbi:MAG: alpha-glucan family phosphorylase [Tepidisphaeraceae bacterium]
MALNVIPTLRTFQVFPDIPQSLQPLRELAGNLWWTWNHDAAELFRRLDRVTWDKINHNPVRLLGLLTQEQLAEAASDAGYLAQLDRVYQAFKKNMSEPAWFQKNHPEVTDARIAYFSAEFGLHESLPIYSGGLGVLAGDHLKSASELGLPLVGVGLLYHHGYFQQYLSADGWQQEAYPELDFHNLAVEPVKFTDGSVVQVRVDLPDNAVFIRVWKVSVGRIPLYLLDTNLPENSPADREITSRLYGGGTEMRIKQELVLGIGGARALEAMGIAPDVWHMNEGHSAFLALERIRKLLADPQHADKSFDEVRQAVMACNVFTTHTPVPAGIDMFPPDLVVKYFKNYYSSLKLDEEGFLALGREDVTNKKQGFSMAVLAIRLADGCNAVSKLHGEVSRDMWHSIWPGVPTTEVPIQHVTNGVHVRSWISPDLAFTLDRYLGDAWMVDPTKPDAWDDVDQIPDEELWRSHERCRERMVINARLWLKQQLSNRGASSEEQNVADGVLDPEALTIGFARRFATYKRGALILRDRERIKQIITQTNRPIQFVFAGKAHPADQGGKELIRQIVDFARDPAIRRKFVFIENYDMGIARTLVQGVDVWLNTPRRPYEASGTSGMKAAANGIPNCSILDGWWVEGYEPGTGWAIGRGEQYSDAEYQDHIEAQSLYDTIERQIMPLFYDRGPDNVPREWVRRMKNNLKKLAPVFNTNRMVAQYANTLYLPAVSRGRLLMQDALKRGVQLAHSKDFLRHNWGGIRVLGVNHTGNGHYKVGESIAVEAIVDLGKLTPEQVRLQLFCGAVNSERKIDVANTIEMQHSRVVADGRHIYTGKLDCRTSGRYGFALRAIPGVSDMATPFEPGLILWS